MYFDRPYYPRKPADAGLTNPAAGSRPRSGVPPAQQETAIALYVKGKFEFIQTYRNSAHGGQQYRLSILYREGTGDRYVEGALSLAVRNAADGNREALIH